MGSKVFNSIESGNAWRTWNECWVVIRWPGAFLRVLKLLCKNQGHACLPPWQEIFNFWSNICTIHLNSPFVFHMRCRKKVCRMKSEDGFSSETNHMFHLHIVWVGATKHYTSSPLSSILTVGTTMTHTSDYSLSSTICPPDAHGHPHFLPVTCSPVPHSLITPKYY